MNWVFLLAGFLATCSPAAAAWVALEKPFQPAGRETVYFDPDTIHRSGVHASLWQLTDIKWNNVTRYLSSKTHKEFDCEKSRVRTLQVIEFSRQMGTGRSATGYIENGNWQPVEAGGINDRLMKKACGKQ
ncbi:MAG: hypothetical protein U0236_09210 [Nitrospira sp.]